MIALDRVLDVFKRRTAANTLTFIDKVIEEMPFPIQRVQTDRGTEFFAEKVQLKLMEHGIKFRPNKPGSPHLNGKVERSQRTDKEEFYSTVNFDLDELKNECYLSGSITTIGNAPTLTTKLKMNAFSYRIISVIFNYEK